MRVTTAKPNSLLYDLLIIGGGINGAGVARDAAGRGLKTVLLEANDLASGTSSASTKLLHGGLRYLENYEFKMVQEALRERDIVMRIAPHLSHPLRFVLPDRLNVRPRWLIRLGLYIYDLLALGSPLPRSCTHKEGMSYYDGWGDDARLVICNALDAAARGASIQVRTAVQAAQAQPDGTWIVTTSTGVTYHARAIVNAAGPWAGSVLAALGVQHKGMPALRLVRGSHIILPRLYAGNHAMLLQQPDGRVVFTIPYEDDFTLVGTTEVAQQDMQSVMISDAERDYLLAAIADTFGRNIEATEIVATYSGVRPLFDDGASEARRVTRDYHLLLRHHDGAPILSMLGGKLTSYRAMAEKTVDQVCHFLGHCVAPWTATAPLPGGEKKVTADDMPAFLPLTVRKRYARLYGTRATMIYGAAHNLADMGIEIAPGLYAREVDYLMRYEWAQTPEDIIKRRTKLYLHMTPDHVTFLGAYMDQRGTRHG